MALATFPLPYVFDIDTTKKYSTKEVQFYSNKKQVQIQSPNPIRSWSIKVRGTPEQYNTLEAFFDLQYGNAGVFTFIDENDEERNVRFSDSTLKVKKYRDFNTQSPTHGQFVGFEATIELEEAL